MNTKHPFDFNWDDKHGPMGGIFEVDRFAEVLNDCAYVKKWPEIPLERVAIVLETIKPTDTAHPHNGIISNLISFSRRFAKNDEEYQRYFNFRFSVSPLIPHREALMEWEDIIRFDKNLRVQGRSTSSSI